MTQTALAVTQNTNLPAMSPGADEWKIIREQSEMLIKTGFLPVSIKTPEQAAAIILQGRELGIPAMAALGTINVIQQKPTISPQLMLALINRSGQLENIEITLNGESVTCTMKRKGRTAHTEVFGKVQAADMGLSGKDNYKKQAATMYRWRAVAACARTVFPDVILGLYTPDEMGAENVNAAGELIPEAATIHRLPPQPVTPVKAKEFSKSNSAIDTQITGMCKKLNIAGDSIEWSVKKLADYAGELFDCEIGSANALDAEQKEILLGDLEGRLQDLTIVTEERAAIETETVEGEVIEGETETEAVF